MLEIRKERLFSKEYVAEDGGALVARMTRSFWRSGGGMWIGERTYRMQKQGVFKETYTLFEDESPVLEVVRPSSFRTRLVFRHDGSEFVMRSRKWFSQALLVEADGSLLGQIHPRGFFGSRAVVDLPDSLSLPIRLFLGWIAMAIWESEHAAAAAS